MDTSLLKYVKTRAYARQVPEIPIIDLVSAGNYGLVVAMSRFDETFNVPLKAYAKYYIDNEIGKYINQYFRFYNLPVSYATEFEDRNTPEDDLELKELLTLSLDAQDTLSEREQDLIHSVYAREISLAAWGRIQGISRERARQIHESILTKLRNSLV